MGMKIKFEIFERLNIFFLKLDLKSNFIIYLFIQLDMLARNLINSTDVYCTF